MGRPLVLIIESPPVAARWMGQAARIDRIDRIDRIIKESVGGRGLELRALSGGPLALRSRLVKTAP